MSSMKCHPRMSKDETKKFDQTCPKIYNVHQCPNMLKSRLCTPLEERFADVFGDYDEGQNILMNSRIGATDCVLIENASDIVAKIKDIPGVLEQIIMTILRANKSDYVFLGSYELPDILDEDEEEDREEKKEKLKDYYSIIGKIKQGFKKGKQKYILHTALFMSKDAGHYAIIIRNGTKVFLFDSMQGSITKDTEGVEEGELCLGDSAYTPNFKQIAKDVFSIEAITPEKFTEETSLQITGGFIEGPEEFKTYKAFAAQAQDMDSQNHFCYFWAIWYMHAFILGYNVQRIAQEMYKECVHPLIVIKKYIWCIIHFMTKHNESLTSLIYRALRTTDKPITVSQNDLRNITKFFLMHFRYVWDDLGTGKYNRYAIIDYELAPHRQAKSINDCFLYSITKTPYVLDDFCIDVSKRKKRRKIITKAPRLLHY